MAKHILFDGTSVEEFLSKDGSPAAWKILEDGSFTPDNHGDIYSKFTFKDAHIHVEWMEPESPGAEGQWKGNSGVYIHGCYEVQVLDSYGIEEMHPYDCGGIYTLYAPLVNACRPPLEWQYYDIYFRAPRYDDAGKVTEDARATIIQNGQVIHNNIVLYKSTPGGLGGVVPQGPLMLQDHWCPVRFRNVWVETL